LRDSGQPDGTSRKWLSTAETLFCNFPPPCAVFHPTAAWPRPGREIHLQVVMGPEVLGPSSKRSSTEQEPVVSEPVRASSGWRLHPGRGTHAGWFEPAAIGLGNSDSRGCQAPPSPEKMRRPLVPWISLIAGPFVLPVLELSEGGPPAVAEPPDRAAMSPKSPLSQLRWDPRGRPRRPIHRPGLRHPGTLLATAWSCSRRRRAPEQPSGQT